MRIIPVIDLKGGVVVRAVAGERANYQPIVSHLASDSSPSTVARSFVNQLGFSEAYVADLDAIAATEPDWRAYDAIVANGLRVLLDSGVQSSRRIDQLTNWDSDATRLARIVVASESLPNLDAIPALVASAGAHRITFSIDLKQGAWHGASTHWNGLTPEQVAQRVVDLGVTSLIILDLAAVGTDQGPLTLDVCRRIRDALPSIELISGGGVRNSEHLDAFSRSGCDGVLISSALHNGNLRLV